MIIKNADRGCGMPRKNVARMGIASAQLPAEVRYATTLRRFSKITRPSLTAWGTEARSSLSNTMEAASFATWDEETGAFAYDREDGLLSY